MSDFRRLTIVALEYVGMPLAAIGLAFEGRWFLALFYAVLPIHFTAIVLLERRGQVRCGEKEQGR
jgi:hypothetical protein